MRKETINSNVVVKNSSNKGVIGMIKTNNTKKMIKSAIKYVVKDLGLTQYPTVKIESNLGDGNDTYVMASTGLIYYKGPLFNQIVSKTESDYVLHINKDSLNKQIKRYTIGFGNKQAAYDYVYLLVCHELRHMWQYQEQYQVGNKRKVFDMTETLYGHGADKLEMDANSYMIEIANRRNIGHLAEYMEIEQRYEGISNQLSTNFYKEVKTKNLKALKHYNKPLYFLTVFLFGK